ncbi:hypothetical protein KGQ71_01710 [Patescibacteria group bacterium]|nr:hypothetical protein [Patescibacteria group bacterium]
MTRPGFLFILDGDNGTGKDTQSELLVKRLRQEGLTVRGVHALESNNRVIAFRKLALDPEQHPRSDYAEALAFFTMHAETVAEVVLPLRANGTTVVLNRAPETAYIYNVLAKGLTEKYPELSAIYHRLMTELKPDRVIILDTDVETARLRSAQQKETDHLQDKEDEEHQARRRFFQQLAAENSWSIVDASGSIAAVFDLIWQEIKPIIV